MFAENFRTFMSEQNMSYNALAKATGIPQSTISGWINRGNKPNIDDIIKIADFFNTSIDYICGREREDGIIVVNGQQRESVIPAELENIYIKLDSMHRNILIGIARNVLEAQKQGA